MKEYLNLRNFAMDLQITRYKTMHVKIGISSYDSKIADKFPSILQLVEEKVAVEEEVVEEIKEEEVVEEIKEEEVVEEKVAVEEVIEEIKKEEVVEEKVAVEEVIEEVVENNVNYAEMSYKQLKEVFNNRELEIDGRITSRNMIKALEVDDL